MREVNIQPQSWTVVDAEEGRNVPDELGESEDAAYSFGYARV
jgi:hypothetical protein